MEHPEIAVQRFVTGPIETNTYLVLRDGSCLCIDPSSGCDEVSAYINERGGALEGICLTHGHFDHILGIEEMRSRFVGVGVWIHPRERILLKNPVYNGSPMMGMEYTYEGPTEDLVEGEARIGSFHFRVLYVPGHSPGGCAFVFGRHCLCGDSIFAGSIGRADFPGCDGEALLSNIRSKILTLPDETILYPGHGGRTTVK